MQIPCSSDIGALVELTEITVTDTVDGTLDAAPQF
jgi:hypothetical protein